MNILHPRTWRPGFRHSSNPEGIVAGAAAPATLSFALILGLGACGSAASPAASSINATQPASGAAISSQPATGSAPDPCTLITKAEAEAAFGVTFEAPTTEADAHHKTCTYDVAGHGTDLKISVNIGSFSRANLDAIRHSYPDAVDVPGVGDAAFQFARLINVVKGSTFFIVGTGAGTAIISDDKLQELARTAASRV